MTFTLWRKLLRDARIALPVVAIILFGFEMVWVKVVSQITSEIAPMLSLVSMLAGFGPDWMMNLFFEGPGKLFQTFMGGEQIRFDNPQDLLSVGFMHPLVQIIICIWAVGRASSAIAGEIDRGTMELLLAQPLNRTRIVLAHLLVDLAVLPVLCLALWFGSYVGTQLFSPFTVNPDVYLELKMKVPSPLPVKEVHAGALFPALFNVFALLFAISGYTMWLSARGRSRNRVLGLAIVVTLVQFIVNVIGQLWDGAMWLRPFTVFYYYQPQMVALKDHWTVDPGYLWRDQPLIDLNVIAVLLAVGLAGYLMAWRTFCRRDIPAPL